MAASLSAASPRVTGESQLAPALPVTLKSAAVDAADALAEGDVEDEAGRVGEVVAVAGAAVGGGLEVDRHGGRSRVVGERRGVERREIRGRVDRLRPDGVGDAVGEVRARQVVRPIGRTIGEVEHLGRAVEAVAIPVLAGGAISDADEHQFDDGAT